MSAQEAMGIFGKLFDLNDRVVWGWSRHLTTFEAADMALHLTMKVAVTAVRPGCFLIHLNLFFYFFLSFLFLVRHK